jgi:hypothetical protein
MDMTALLTGNYDLKLTQSYFRYHIREACSSPWRTPVLAMVLDNGARQWRSTSSNGARRSGGRWAWTAMVLDTGSSRLAALEKENSLLLLEQTRLD